MELKSQSKRQRFLKKLIPALLVLLALAGLGFWIRYQFFLLNGGLEKSYTDWAIIHYFGGITPAYIQGAENILNLRPWSVTFYPPGYSLFIALWKLLGIDNLQTLRLVQAAIDCLTVFPIFYLLTQLGVRLIFSIATAGIYAVAPLWAFGSVILLAESLSPAFIVWLLALMVFASRRNQMFLWLAIGFLVAMSALVRPDLILLIGLVLLWVLFTSPKGGKIRAITMTIVGFASLIFLWGIYNKVNHGHWIFTTSAGTYALWSGLGQLPNHYGYFVDDAKAGELLTKHGMVQFSPEAIDFWGAAYKKAWSEHPEYVLKTILWRIFRIPFDHRSYIGSLEAFEGINTYFSQFAFFVLCLSLILLIIRRKFSTAYIISMPLVYALTSLGLVYYESRYIRYVPLSYIFAAAIAINFLYSWFLSLSPLIRKKAVSIGLATVAIVVIGSYTSRNMLVLVEETAKQILVYEMEQAFAKGHTTLIGALKKLNWTKALPEASFNMESNGLHVRTSQGRSHYQLITPIDVSNFSSIRIEYDIRVEDGGMALGLLLPDGSRFIETRAFNNPDDHVGSLTVPIKSFESLSLVLMNSRAEDGQSRFVVRKLNLHAI